MFDAWSAYDPSAAGYLISEKHTAPDVGAARDEAISYAAYRILSQRYANAFGAEDSLASFHARMLTLGYDPAFSSTDGNTPAALGNRIAATLLEAYLEDGSNEAIGYADNTGYVPLNAPLLVFVPVEIRIPEVPTHHLDHWQPLSLKFMVAQNGIPLPDTIQRYVGPHWGNVTPFAMAKESPADLYSWSHMDPGPPPSFSGTSAAAWKQDFLSVVRFSSQLDPSDNVVVDISPAVWGNRPLGTHLNRGYGVNPVSGGAYPPNVVKRGDYMRVLAEFWADGPQSETPPGHWNVLANEISDNPLLEHRLGGVGPLVERLEWDVKLYFVLNGAVHDAAIAAWGIKRAYDYIRPISAIRYMGDHVVGGQSSNPNFPRYHPDGLPLEFGLVDVITAQSTQPGERHAHLVGHEGRMAVRAWQGEPADTENEAGGVGWILAEEWVPYQRSTFVTPAFAAYVSGHSTFSRASAEVLTRFTGSPYFPGGLGTMHCEQNEFLEFEQGPSIDVVLQWASYYDAADEAGISRLYGGIHCASDDFKGRILGSKIGNNAFDFALHWLLNPDADNDEDGLNNASEVEAGSNPLEFDSDGDGLSDGEEVLVYGSDPLATDSDGDGLSDGDEVLDYGTDPLLADSDGDGDGDAFELEMGSDPSSAASQVPVASRVVLLLLGLGILVLARWRLRELSAPLR